MIPSFATLYGRVVFIFLLLSSLVSLQAHNSSKGLTAVNVQMHGDRVEAQFAISFFDVGVLFTLDKNKDGTVTKQEVDATLEELREASIKDLQFTFNGERVLPTQAISSIQESNFETKMVFANLSAKGFTLQSPIIRRLTPDHQQFVTVMDESGTIQAEATLTAADIKFSFGSEQSGTETYGQSAGAAFVLFLKKGFEHVLYDESSPILITDHLLFLLALLVICKTFRDVVKIVTSFTLAHSITLALATLNLVPTSGRIIEPLIAATIVYVGVENLFKLKTLQWRWVITFLFGLIHGFGFANTLQNLTKGGGIALKLVGFNLGVELGQIAVAAIVFPLFLKLKEVPQWGPRWVPICSSIVVLTGGYWFVQRIWF